MSSRKAWDDEETLSSPGGGAGVPGPRPKVEGYEVLGPLGEGGMGTVWRAVQQSTRRDVALKLLRGDHFASERARRRFEREVELAAGLEHPHIARVYDSGVHQGVYYYAMELAEGLALDEYVTEHRLGQRGILELLRSVCEAVQHAHQRGVIHRDLKPSNILVTEDGQPHVLDFGLAKAFLEAEPDVTVSVDGEVAGTPAYMSPEQAAGKTDQVDTRSDVYSLGVILFHLLTGQFPHDLSGSRQEVLRRIAEGEVPRPRSLTKEVNRELEALLLKALAHDPEARYASAGELVDDIGNYLTGDPLTARTPTTIYFLRKRLTKYRGRVAVAALMLAALVGLAAGSYVSIARARDEARQEADKATAVIEFIQSAMATGDPAYARGTDVTVGKILYNATALAGEMFAGRPLVEAAVRETLGKVYLGRGEVPIAHGQFRQVLEIRRGLLAKDHPDTLLAMHNMACALAKLGRYAEAERLLTETLASRRRVLGREHPDALSSMEDLATALRCQDKFAEAEKLCAEALEIRQRVSGPEHPDTSTAMNSLASILGQRGRYVEAERLYRRVLETRRRVLRPRTSPKREEFLAALGRAFEGQRLGLDQGGADHPDTLMTMNDLACVLRNQGKLEEAEELLREALAGQQRVLGPRHFDTVNSMNNLALVLADQGKLEEAEKQLRSVLEAQRSLLGDGHPKTLKAMSDMALVLEPQGRYPEAEALLRPAVEALERTMGKEHGFTLAAMHNLATVLAKQRRYAEAEPLHRELLGRRERVLGEDHRDTLETKHNLGVAMYMQGRTGEAETCLREVLAARRRSLGAEHREALLCQINLAAALRKQGKNAEAEALCRQALEISRRTLGQQHSDSLYAMDVLAAILVAQGKVDEAEALRQEREETVRRASQKEEGDAPAEKASPVTPSPAAAARPSRS